MLIQPFLNFRRTLAFAICAFTLILTQQASATVFDVNRVIGTGSVTGFLETDGTLGVLSTGSIIDFQLTISAPGLSGGSPDVINFANSTQIFADGTALSATLTELTFDFLATGLMILQGGNNFNFWCLDGLNRDCGGDDSTEFVGFASPTAAVSYANVGAVVIGTVQSTGVPVPMTLSLMMLGLFAVGYSRRKAD